MTNPQPPTPNHPGLTPMSMAPKEGYLRMFVPVANAASNLSYWLLTVGL